MYVEIENSSVELNFVIFEYLVNNPFTVELKRVNININGVSYFHGGMDE